MRFKTIYQIILILILKTNIEIRNQESLINLIILIFLIILNKIKNLISLFPYFIIYFTVNRIENKMYFFCFFPQNSRLISQFRCSSG